MISSMGLLYERTVSKLRKASEGSSLLHVFYFDILIPTLDPRTSMLSETWEWKWFGR